MLYKNCNECKCSTCSNNICAVHNCEICMEARPIGLDTEGMPTIVCSRYINGGNCNE